MESNDQDQMLHEILKLSRANNELLHHMRRTAFFWGFVKFLIYALFLLAPIWFYMTYLNDTVQQLLQAMDKIEGVNTQAQGQLQGFEQAWQAFESKFNTSTTTAQ